MDDRHAMLERQCNRRGLFLLALGSSAALTDGCKKVSDYGEPGHVGLHKKTFSPTFYDDSQVKSFLQINPYVTFTRFSCAVVLMTYNRQPSLRLTPQPFPAINQKFSVIFS